MARWWPRLLWPALDRSGHAVRGRGMRIFALAEAGGSTWSTWSGRGHDASYDLAREDRRDDAFATLVEVLRRRLLIQLRREG